ncbi:PAS domain-containing hybrid sensor histidine kinase/response regulator [Parabacteroides provencensis]|uniref:PAS domain-containing hybrid sensor histidine kinase/response regulator n=1 Tax=Parabacteroides provencensis TaxID=1944636 RepID=UPI000C157F17|nr:PAS domain-containing hybrid sensor histidine kinase/response regulator [Parabacteroides provencensis]
METGVIKTLLVLILAFILCPETTLANQNTGKKKKVLLISSYSPLKEGGINVISSFEKTLKDKTDVSISIEYMDSESSPNFETWAIWMKQLFKAYQEPPSAVVLLGNEAWSVYRKVCIPEWHTIPVILGNVKPIFIDYEKLTQTDSITNITQFPKMETTFDNFQITGYFYNDFIKENLQLIKKLQPEVRYVAFYYDNRYSLRYFSDYLCSLFDEIDSLDVCFLSGDKLSTTQLIDSISNMDSRHALLSAGWYTDVNHYPHAYTMLHNELSRSKSHVLYQVRDQDFSSLNFLGGYFILGKNLGNDIANLTYDVLTKGIKNSPSFQMTPSLPQYHINYPTLQYYGINPKNLPPNTIFYNEAPSLIKEYPMEVFLFVMVIVLMSILFIVILHFRKRKEEQYKIANQRMMRLLKAMPDMAFIFDSSLKITDIINPQENVLLGLDWQEMIGKSLQDAIAPIEAFKEAASIITKNLIRTKDTKQVFSFDYQVKIDDNIHYGRARTVPFNKDNVIYFCHDVTIHVEAERKVLKLQTFLQSVIDNLPIGLSVKDMSNEFRYLFYNDKACEFYGDTNSSDLLGKNDFEVHDPEAALFRQEDIMTSNSKIPLSFERIITDKKTKQPCKWGIITKSRLLNNDGSSYIISVIVDTTEIRKKELELENTRKELSIALDAGSLSAWMYDVKKQWFSSLYKESVTGNGFSLDHCMEFIHPDDVDKYREFIRQLSCGEKEKQRQVFRFMRNGSYNFYETYAMVIRSGKTGEVKRVVGTEKDISEEIRKQKEQEENKFKLEFAFDAAQIIPWEYNISTNIFSSPNPAVFEYTDVSLDKYLTYMNQEDMHLLRDGIKDLISGDIKSMDIQVRVAFPGKEMRWYEIHGLVFERDKEGKVCRIIGVRWDITDLKMTDELIELRNKAEESNRLKSAFLANMSHEIRTPLNAIVGFSNLIIETDDRSEIEEYSHIIEANNELLLQLINDILDLSKIEAGQLEFNYSDVDVSTIFYDLEQIYKYRIKKGVSLETDLPEQSCIIYSEKNRLTQVISNFLSNASKFTTSGSIRMGYSYTADSLRFYVQDTGKGISPENIPFVFNRFAKFDSFVQGTGLGLSICESIIHHLGGEIGVDSELNKGSLFWFTLPCKTKPSRPATTVKDQKAEIKISTKDKVANRQYTLMVAEDNDDNYLSLLHILKKDYQVIRASNGKDAVRLYHETHPDLILMDIKLPLMNGLEATKEIRKHDLNIPIVALTAYTFDNNRKQALNAGCTDFLAKPVNEKQLKELLKALL